MQPDERKMLEDLLRISEQNNRLLRKMRRGAMWGTIIHIVYWVIIIAIGYIGYLYLQPYINQLTQVVQSQISK